MSNLKEKIKNALPGHHKEGKAGMATTPGATTTGAYETTGVAADATTTTAGEAAVCGKESFTKVEDRPIVIEQKEYIKEHRPVEKEFVTETRFAGEREMAEGRTTEHLGTEERIIAEAQPKPTCE